MTTVAYNIPAQSTGTRSLARGWLMLGLLALIASGVFSILLVLSRTPRIQDMLPWLDFFHIALVVHVDLSVLIWFLAFGGLLWTLAGRRDPGPGRWLALILAGLGTGIIALAPFAGAGAPLMNNYVPVLQHPLFFTGLGLFGTGILIQILDHLFAARPVAGGSTPVSTLHLGIYTAALAGAVAMVALVWSYLSMPPEIHGHAYFELLFWGGGHIVQFTFTQLMLVAWLWLGSASGASPRIGHRAAAVFLVLGLVPVFIAPAIHLTQDLLSGGYRTGYTRLMEYGHGVAAVVIGVAVTAGLFRSRDTGETQRPLRAALVTSLLLFTIGGAIGFLITGVNTIIPAHYHGSIVGVTLAFMGLTYHLLPQLGYRAPVGRLAVAQPYVYAVGQLLHISGLAWSGALGIQRKTAGAAQGLDRGVEIAAMGVMGLGGLVAIIGGFLFLVVCLRAIWPGQKAA